MVQEIEAKFQVADFEAVRRRLSELGAVCLGSDLQTDTYYDTPDRNLLDQDKGLRIRCMSSLTSQADNADQSPDRDGRPLLTYKGPADSHAEAKIRQELQTRVDSHEAMDGILTALGLKTSLVIQKKRTSHQFGDSLVELDELPVIGRFVEIEAPSPERIEEIRRELGIASEPCKDHYISLVTKACRRVGSDCTEVTFASCAQCDSA